MTLYLDEDNNIRARTSIDDMSLAELAVAIRKLSGLTTGTLERNAGIDHPKYRNLERGKFKGLMPLFIALDYLGYEMSITKRRV
jgi:hypothetical protein